MHKFSAMRIEEVVNSSQIRAFLDLNPRLQKGNPFYIQPLDEHIEEVFNPSKNKAFKYGTAKRWIVKSESNEVVGRIAAFTTSKYINKGTNFKTGGVGFFDSINDFSVAQVLFDTAKQWLIEQGMEAMDGPINFGDRDKWWGLLVEGFEDEPVFRMPYNPPYYESFFEQYGFKNYYNQYWYRMNVDDPLAPKFQERFQKFASKPDYSARHVKMKDLPKYAQDFATVYNSAWAQHGEAKEITPEQVMKIFNSMKPIMDERMVWFAYYKEDPIAMFINIPDVNQYFKHFKGKLGLFEKLRLLWMKKTGYCKKLTGLAFGVVPKYQSLGIDSYLIQSCANFIQNKGWYNHYEMGWAGDWNPRMLNIYKNLGGTQNRRMVTYRFIFDENKHPFERHPVMEYSQTGK
mgnify:CR=1 FL=1